MLPKAHLTSCSSISGFTWVTPTSSLSGSLCPFLYISSVHSCYLLLISSASVRSLTFLSCIVPNFAWSIPMESSVFLKRSILFTIYYCPIILAFFTYKFFLISSCYSLEVCISLGVSFPVLFAVHFSHFLSCFEGLLRQSLSMLTFVFLEDAFGHHFPYNVTNLHP